MTKMMLDVKAFKNFKGEICAASTIGNGIDLRYLAVVEGTTVTYRVKSKGRTVHKGDCPMVAAEAFNRLLAKAEKAKPAK